MSEYPTNSSNNPTLRSVVAPEQGGDRVTDQPTPTTNELRQIPTLPEAPDNTSVLWPKRVETEKPWFQTTATKIGAGVLVLLAGGATVVGAMLPRAETAPEQGPDTVATAPANPGETAAPSPEVLTVKSLELPATLTPEQLGTTFVQDRLSRWDMAGSVGGDQLQNDWIRKGLALGVADKDFLTPTISKNGDTFADALFVSSWRENPDLVKWVDATKANNLSGLETWLKTYKSGDSNDVEPFSRTSTVESTTVVSQTTDTVSISSAATEHTNADKNRAVKLDPGLALIDGSKFTMNATFQLVNGAWKISALDMFLR